MQLLRDETLRRFIERRSSMKCVRVGEWMDVVQRWWLHQFNAGVRMMDIHCCVGSATIEKFRFMALPFRYHSHHLSVDRCTNSYPIQTKTGCMSIASSCHSILQQLFQILSTNYLYLSCFLLSSYLNYFSIFTYIPISAWNDSYVAAMWRRSCICSLQYFFFLIGPSIYDTVINDFFD